MANMGKDKPEELAVQTVTRAKFCESLAPYTGLLNRASDLFLVGLFSLIDSFLDRPKEDILTKIPIDDEIKGAILGEKNTLGKVYDFVLSYERGDWATLAEQGVKIGIDETRPPQLYLEALKWGQESFSHGVL